MKKFNLKVGNNSYDVTILNYESHKVKLDVNGNTYEVEVEKKEDSSKTPTLVRHQHQMSTETHKATALTSNPSEKKGAGVIKAPLPGTIIKILVNEGDSVKIGTNLLIWEAMKMENNLTSDREGVVKSIKVKPGDNIFEGDVLVEIG